MLPASAKRLVIARHGARLAESIELVDAALEPPGAGEVVMRNRFAGVNAVYDHRLATGQIPAPSGDGAFPFGFGFEAVGEVAAVGPDVADFDVGDTVASVRFGHGYCDYHRIAATELIPVPEATPAILTLIPTGTSALVALEQVGELGSGERVLISAAAGGLGHVAAQMAKLTGNRVTALTGSEEKARRLRSLGIDRVINYRSGDLATALTDAEPDGFDLIFDSVGGEVFDTLVEHLADHGRLVVAGFTSDADRPAVVSQQRIYTKLYWKAASVRAFMNAQFREFQADARERLIRQYLDGELSVWVNEPVFDGLAALPEAVECLLSGRNVGKVVLRV